MTSYPAIVRDMTERLAVPPLAAATLVLDQTGVGRPLFDLFHDAGLGPRLVGVTITAGTEASQAAWNQWHVPKTDLISALVLALQGERLQIAEALPEAATLRGELQGYRRRVTAAANTVFGTWREGQHDDLLLSLAIAVWYAEHGQPGLPQFF
jgi:hypothetical protein